jgi:hypothetical protein
MMNLLLQAFLNSLPVEYSTQLNYMRQALEKTGAAEGVFQVPNVGKCKVVITKLED